MSEASLFLVKWEQGHLLGGGVKKAWKGRAEKPAGIPEEVDQLARTTQQGFQVAL